MRRILNKQVSEKRRLAIAEETAIAHVALVVAELMEASGITNKELAERLGVTEGRVSQILSAETNPTIRTLGRIAGALERDFKLTFPERTPNIGQLEPCSVQEGDVYTIGCMNIDIEVHPAPLDVAVYRAPEFDERDLVWQVEPDGPEFAEEEFIAPAA